MNFLKRIGIFLLVNFLVMTAISIIINLFGIGMEGKWGLLLMCAMFGMGGSFISLLLSKSMAKWSYKIQILQPGARHPQAAFLVSAIQNMAAERGIKTPEIGIYNSPDANAFATGASANSALVAFSSGLVERLSEDELAAVAGHELTHITNGDMVTMTLLMGVANTFVMFFARLLTFVIDNSLRDNRGGGLGYFGYVMVVTLLQNVLMLLAYIPISAFSRWREYRADAGAAKLAGAGAMIEALKQISAAYTPQKQGDSFALAKINNKRRVSLFATHPSIEDRIARLQAQL
jgi:heat shock protein HtpX